MNIEEEIKNAQYDPTMEKILGIIERKTNNNSHNYLVNMVTTIGSK